MTGPFCFTYHALASAHIQYLCVQQKKLRLYYEHLKIYTSNGHRMDMERELLQLSSYILFGELLVAGKNLPLQYFNCEEDKSGQIHQ